MKLGRVRLRLDPPLSELEIVIVILGSVPLMVAALLILLWFFGVSR